jgi:hypothetical protein
MLAIAVNWAELNRRIDAGLEEWKIFKPRVQPFAPDSVGGAARNKDAVLVPGFSHLLPSPGAGTDITWDA